MPYLKVISPYHSNFASYQESGQVIEVDEATHRFLMADAPGCFEDCDPPAEAKEIDEPPEDKAVKSPPKSKSRTRSTTRSK